MSEPLTKEGWEKGSKKGCIYSALVIGTLLVLLACIAIPDFLKFNNKVLQAEAKWNLGLLYNLQMKYHAEHGVFASHTTDQDCFQLLGWQPEGNNRYAYYCDTAEIKNKRPIDSSVSRPPMIPVTKDHFVIIAVGNVDNDPELDYWTITETKNLRNQLVLAGGDVVGGGDL